MNWTGRLLMILVLTLGVGLAACGRKPSQLDPPSGDDAPDFPQVYPSE
jgi:predicted small lipoprotein YifL